MELKTIIWIFIIIFSLTAAITLLGITNVIKGIKENYLNKLFYTLIIEVVIAVVAVFKGVDFNQEGVPLNSIIQRAEIQKEFETEQATADYLVEQIKLSQKVPQLNEKLSQTKNVSDQLKAQVNQLQSQIDSCDTKFQDSQRSFYSKVEKLRKLIVKYSGSINLLYRPTEKAEVFDVLEDIFEILGTLNNEEGGKIEVMQKQYRLFEKRHGLNEEGKLMIMEYETSILIREYLNKINPVN